jgi:hypothetical protein
VRDTVAVSAMDWAARIVARTQEIAGGSLLSNTAGRFKCVRKEDRRSE